MAESMQGLKRSHRCTEVGAAHIGQEVTVMGWVQKSRNKGGIIFVDLRDRSGILQIIFEEGDCGADSFAKAEKPADFVGVGDPSFPDRRKFPNQRRTAPEIPLSGFKEAGHPEKPHAAEPDCHFDPPVFGGRRFFGD